MNKIANLSAAERSGLFAATAEKRGLGVAVVEKDFWVCWTLGRIFTDPWLGEQLLFKGGTSLSKVYGLIERFSEDIDLILDWRKVTSVDPRGFRTSTQQDLLNKEMNSQAQAYIAEKLLPKLTEVLHPHGKLRLSGTDGDAAHVVEVHYPTHASSAYLRPVILLEIGPLAAWLPHEEGQVTSYAAESFPAVFTRPHGPARTLSARRTFWEKATILHQEAHRPESNPVPMRYSRHYYDLACMARSPVRSAALADRALMREVAEFKARFYPRKWARYDLAQQGLICLMPPPHAQAALAKDYQSMQEMMFGEPPTWEVILAELAELEREIQSLSKAP